MARYIETGQTGRGFGHEAERKRLQAEALRRRQAREQALDTPRRQAYVEALRASAPTVDKAVQGMGLTPGIERPAIIPRYSKREGLVAPELVYQGARAVASPGVAARGGDVSDEDALNVGFNLMGGGAGTSAALRRPTPGVQGRTVGMATTPKKGVIATVTEKIPESIRTLGTGKAKREAENAARVKAQADAKAAGMPEAVALRAQTAGRKFGEALDISHATPEDAVKLGGKNEPHLYIGAIARDSTAPKGTGRQMLDAALAEADAGGYPTLVSASDTGSGKLRQWYADAGFVPTGQGDVMVRPAPAKAGEVQRPKRKQGKKEADTYRQLYEEKGYQPVLAAALRGEHFKPDPQGGFVGAPRHVETPADIRKMRRDFDQQLNFAVEGLEYADPNRVGTWYERAKAGQAASNEPWQLPRSLEQNAVYSAGAAPEIEHGFAIRHHNADILGTGETAYRGTGKRTLDEAVAADEPADLAFKVGEYRGKIDPRQSEHSPFGVNDFRMGQTYGYTLPDGTPWQGGVTDTMHPFMDLETVLAGNRANKRALGGITDWTGSKIQEFPWVLGKADDFYRRGQTGRYAPENWGGSETKAKVAALREANNTAADYYDKHGFNITSEQVPGRHTGHRPDVLDMTFEEKRAYGNEGRWDTETPYAFDTEHGTVGAGRRDALGRAIGWRQEPSIESVGNYVDASGITHEPMTIHRPQVDFANKGKYTAAGQEAAELAKASGWTPEEAAKAKKAATLDALRQAGRTEMPAVNEINDPTAAALKFQEMFRGGIDAQEAVAGHLPVTSASRTGKKDLLLELPGGAPRTPEEMNAVLTALRGQGVDEGLFGNLTASKRGLHMFTSFLGEDAAKQSRAALEAGLGETAGPGTRMAPAFGPEAKLSEAGTESLYEPVTRRAEEAGQGVTLTRILEAAAEAPPNATRNVAGSAEVREIIGKKYARDEGKAGTAADIQKMRAFFRDEDWDAVVKLIRKGMKPAAAMAALGYSMAGMADELGVDE